MILVCENYFTMIPSVPFQCQKICGLFRNMRLDLHLQLRMFECEALEVIINILLCASEAGSLKNRLGSGLRRDTGQGPFSLSTGGLGLTLVGVRKTLSKCMALKIF